MLRSSNEWISKVNTDTERKGGEEAKCGEEQKPDNISLKVGRGNKRPKAN